MTRLQHKRSIIQALFAKSGNLCAYPGCTHELVNAKNKFVAEICHIEAAEPGGAKYNANQDDESRRSFENLLILCHQHHVETDDVDEFPVARMKEFKGNHEALHGKKVFKIDESLLIQIESEMKRYWDQVERTNRLEHVAPDFAVKITQLLSPNDLFEALGRVVARLEHYSDQLRESDNVLDGEARRFLRDAGYDLSVYERMEYYNNPFVNRNWELHNLGVRNGFTDLTTLMLQVEIRFLEEYLKTHSDDGMATLRFKTAKTKMLDLARSAGYTD